MNWKNQLKQLELNKEWDTAIEFLEEIISNNPDNMDAYLSINYLLMNLLVEEVYEKDHDYYADLLKKYFDESFLKFSQNPEYLFYTGVTACISEWYFDLESEEAHQMVRKAYSFDKENLLYKWGFYSYRLNISSEDEKTALSLALEIISNDKIILTMKSKGAVGEYALFHITASISRSSERYFNEK